MGVISNIYGDFMKKVLLISQNSLSMHANNGKTLTNIFQNWDNDSLAQLYFQDEIPESIKFDTFYRIRDIDLIYKLINSSRSAVLKPISLIRVEDHYAQRSKLFLVAIKFIKKIGILKNLFREILYKFNFLYIKDLEKEISNFKPEAIFLVMSDYKFTIDIALNLSRKLNIPIYMYVLDDRYFMLKRNLFYSFLNKKYINKFEKVVEESINCFCIGHSMSNIYTNYFNKKFEVLSNPVNLSSVKVVDKFYEKNKNFYRVLYAGGITLGRFDSILNLAKVLKNVEKRNNISIKFLVCSGDFISKSQLKKLEDLSIDFLGKLNSKDLDKLYEIVDFVTHIESNKKKYTKFTYLSISTKIPECLAKGICLIGYGPSQIASMKLIDENEIGFHINNNLSLENQCQAFIKLINSPELCNKLVTNGINFSKNNFSQDAVSQKIFSIIND